MRKFIIWAGACAVSLALSGCGSYKEHQIKKEAKAAIAAELTDPGSAQFRNVRMGVGTLALKFGQVCGEVNGKNRMGEFVGFRRFLFTKEVGLHQIEYLPTDNIGDDAEMATNIKLFEFSWKQQCDGVISSSDINLLK